MQDENFIAGNNNNNNEKKDTLHILKLFRECIWKTYKVVMRVLVSEKEKLMIEECKYGVIKDDLIVAG